MTEERVYTAHFEQDEDGVIAIWFPALPGCHTQATSMDEARSRAVEALQAHLTLLRAHGKALPEEDGRQVTESWQEPILAVLTEQEV